MEFSAKIVNGIEEGLKNLDYSYDYDSFHGTFVIEAELSCRLRSCRVVIQAAENYMVSYAAVLTETPVQKLMSVGEYLHRINYGLPNGCFSLDYDDGTIHFRTFFDCPDETPTQKQIEDAFAVPLTVLEHYGDGLLKIINEENSLAESVIMEIDGE